MKDIVKLNVLEERVKNMETQNSKEHTTILISVEAINKKLDDGFVTKDEFVPVQKIAYGLVGLVCLTVIGAIIRLVVH